MSNDSIYNLELHETVFIRPKNGPDYQVTRVPGGWLYSIDEGTSPAFVPFNPEFRTKDLGHEA